MRTMIISILFSLCLFIFGGCSSTPNFPSCISIKPPAIHITGEKTVIERQITGDYNEVEKDAWAVSSVKTLPRETEQAKPAASADQELFMALKIREFHLEKISAYKKEGSLGETRTGLVQYIPVDEYEKNRDRREILLSVIKNENDARMTIFRRSTFLALKREATEEEIASFGNQFAKEQRALALKNEWIQDDNGRWGRK